MAKNLGVVVGFKNSPTDSHPEAMTYYFLSEYNGVEGHQAGEIWTSTPQLNSEGKPLGLNDSFEFNFSFKYKHFYFRNNV